MATQDRGFASMDREKQREIARKGGQAAHQKGTAHEWTSDEARAAGRKGGMASRGGKGKLPAPGAATCPECGNRADNPLPSCSTCSTPADVQPAVL